MIINKVSQQIWEDRYQKNKETFEDNIARVAKYLALDDKEFEMFYDVMERCLFYPAGRIMSNSGIGRNLTLNNCFTLNLVPDNMEGIFEYVKKGAITQKAGGGTGYNFSLLRPNGTPTSNDAVASGVVSFMDAFDSQTHTVLQGNRRGANMGCLMIYHPDIEEFLEAKSWEEGKLNHFNLSVLVDDEFMKAKDNNEMITLRYPCMYETGELVTNPSEWKITKEVNAKELWDKIMTKAYNTGEYGVLFYDNMNKDNNLKYMETIITTNPCGEYLAGTLYKNNKPLENHLGACNLGSLFLHNFVENPFTKDAKINYTDLRYAIEVAIRMLDNVIDINNYPLEAYENYQKGVRTIGLGVTGLADMLCMLNIKYDSKEAVEFVDNLMDDISFIEYETSIMLAKEKGAFPYLEDEDREKFASSNYIMKHYKKSSKWKKIIEGIKKYGIRNARLQAIAPTGTLSLTYGNNCSSGLEPIFSLEYERKIKFGGQDDSNIQIYPMRDYAYGEWLKVKDNEKCIVKEDVFQTAMDLSVDAHINILGVMAFHTDMSCSKTINIPTDYPFKKTKEVYDKCHKLGIKGCTIFRPNPVRQGILVTEKQEDKEEQEINQELKHGTWLAKPNDTIYYERKVYTGCSKLILFIGYSQNENRIVDVFVKHTSKGGCKSNIDGIVILMSGILRYGGNLQSIQKALEGVGTCNSFNNAKNKGIKLSKGASCPTAILNTILEFEQEMKGVTPKKIDLLSKMNEKKEEEIFTEEEKKFLKENGEGAFALKYNKCPQCGTEILHTGGCVSCPSCSFSKCE